jgi:hypothetical protein
MTLYPLTNEQTICYEIITKDINQLSLETFKSWLGAFDSKSECIQIGLHGTDLVNPYPFVNCPN